MKPFLKHFSVLLCAVSIFIFSISSSFVEAASIQSTSGSIDSEFQTAFDLLISNPTIKSNDLLVSSFKDSSGYHFVFSSYSRLISYTDDILWTGQGSNTIPYESLLISSTIVSRFGSQWGGYSGINGLTSDSISLLSTYDFSYLYDSSVFWSNNRFYAFDFSNNIHNEWYKFSWGIPLNYYFSNPDLIIVEPSTSSKPSFYGVRVGINKSGFIQWILDNNKLSVINNCGFNFVDSQITSLIDIFDGYSYNPALFLAAFVKNFNIITEYKSIVSLISQLQNLYSEYKDYLNSSMLEEIKPSSANLPHHRTNKDDTSLTTDTDEDDTVISLLREILRTLIYLPSDIFSNFASFEGHLISFLYNWQRLFYHLDNLNFSTSIDIPDDSSFFEYLFTPTYSGFDELESTVTDKFPIISQLSDLPYPQQFLLEDNQVSSLSSYDMEPLPSFSEDDIFNNDNLFSFTVPEDSTSLNGAFNNITFSFVAFSKLKPFIAAFKGIISVISLYIFCKWVIQFVPKILNGYSSSD